MAKLIIFLLCDHAVLTSVDESEGSLRAPGPLPHQKYIGRNSFAPFVNISLQRESYLGLLQLSVRIWGGRRWRERGIEEK